MAARSYVSEMSFERVRKGSRDDQHRTARTMVLSAKKP